MVSSFCNFFLRWRFAGSLPYISKTHNIRDYNEMVDRRH